MPLVDFSTKVIGLSAHSAQNLMSVNGTTVAENQPTYLASRPAAPSKQYAVNHLSTVAPINSPLDYYRPAQNGLTAVDTHADCSEGASRIAKMAEESTYSSTFDSRLSSTPSKVLSSLRLSGSSNLYQLGDSPTPSSNTTTPLRTEQVQLYSLGNDFDPEFFSDRFGTDLTMTRSSSRSDYSISLVGGLVSRMRITSGVTLPSDVPIHLICGSKDVIHS